MRTRCSGIEVVIREALSFRLRVMHLQLTQGNRVFLCQLSHGYAWLWGWWWMGNLNDRSGKGTAGPALFFVLL